MLNRIIILNFVLLLNFTASAAKVETTSITTETKNKLLSYISKIIPDTPTVIKKSPIKNLYIVMFGTKLFYISADGRYLFESSPLIDLNNRSNISEKIVAEARKSTLAKTDPKNMIIYQPTREVKHTITVFTDIDCPYCQKFHNERAELLRQGVKIRYLMYPRAGINSDSYKTAEAVWCAPDKLKAMTSAKEIASSNSRARRFSGELKPQISSPKCVNPIRQQMELLHRLNMEASTPQILLDSGELIRGYLPAPELVKLIRR